MLAGMKTYLPGIGPCVVVVRLVAGVKDMAQAFMAMGLANNQSSLCIEFPAVTRDGVTYSGRTLGVEETF